MGLLDDLQDSKLFVQLTCMDPASQYWQHHQRPNGRPAHPAIQVSVKESKSQRFQHRQTPDGRPAQPFSQVLRVLGHSTGNACIYLTVSCNLVIQENVDGCCLDGVGRLASWLV